MLISVSVLEMADIGGWMNVSSAGYMYQVPGYRWNSTQNVHINQRHYMLHSDSLRPTLCKREGKLITYSEKLGFRNVLIVKCATLYMTI